MSELKVRFIDDTYLEYYNTGKHDLAQIYLKSEADETIAELKAENKRLKKCEIWMKQHFYCEEVIACESAKNRILKRALWLARAERAKTTQLLLKNAIDHLECKYKHRFDNMRLQFHVWGVVKRKCRSKAEKYK